SIRGVRSTSPESIPPAAVMDSGPAPSGASRNDARMLPVGQIAVSPVQPPLQKYSGSLLTQITSTSLAIPAHYRGAFRDRHERRVGMRWTRVARLRRALIRGRR